MNNNLVIENNGSNNVCTYIEKKLISSSIELYTYTNIEYQGK